MLCRSPKGLGVDQLRYDRVSFLFEKPRVGLRPRWSANLSPPALKKDPPEIESQVEDGILLQNERLQ